MKKTIKAAALVMAATLPFTAFSQTVKENAETPIEMVKALFEKGQKNNEIEYKEITNIEGSRMTSTVKQKGEKFYREISTEGASYVMIFDGKAVVSYDPKMKTGTKIEISPEQAQNVTPPFLTEQESNIKFIKKEKANGEPCMVFESTEDGETYTIWISENYGIIVKATSKAEVISEIKNIKKVKIADSVFNAPADIKLSNPNDSMKEIENFIKQGDDMGGDGELEKDEDDDSED